MTDPAPGADGWQKINDRCWRWSMLRSSLRVDCISIGWVAFAIDHWLMTGPDPTPFPTAEAAKRAAEAEAWRTLAGALAKLPVPREALLRASAAAFDRHDDEDIDDVRAALLAALGGE
jgi:hypothetical protein